MDINKLTQKSQEALQSAQTKALRYGHQEVDGEHLLLALLEQPEGLVPRLLARMDVPTEALETRSSASCRAGPASPARASRRARSISPSGSSRSSCAPRTRRSASRTSTSRSSTCCSP